MKTPEPQQTLVYRLDPEVYDQFVADLDAPCIGSQFEKVQKLFQRESPFTTDCD